MAALFEAGQQRSGFAQLSALCDEAEGVARSRGLMGPEQEGDRARPTSSSDSSASGAQGATRAPAQGGAGMVQTSEGKGGVLYACVRPRRRMKGNVNEPLKAPLFLSYDDLSKHFNKPLKQACKDLGICITAFKHLCRKLGISKWPYRAVADMESDEETHFPSGGQGGDCDEDMAAPESDDREVSHETLDEYLGKKRLREQDLEQHSNPDNALQLEDDEVVIFPRRKAKKNGGSDGGNNPIVLNKQILKGYFGMSLRDAAKKMNICITALKKACRKAGIRRWPFRDALPAEEGKRVIQMKHRFLNEQENSSNKSQPQPSGSKVDTKVQPETKVAKASSPCPVIKPVAKVPSKDKIKVKQEEPDSGSAFAPITASKGAQSEVETKVEKAAEVSELEALQRQAQVAESVTAKLLQQQALLTASLTSKMAQSSYLPFGLGLENLSDRDASIASGQASLAASVLVEQAMAAEQLNQKIAAGAGLLCGNPAIQKMKLEASLLAAANLSASNLSAANLSTPMALRGAAGQALAAQSLAAGMRASQSLGSLPLNLGGLGSGLGNSLGGGLPLTSSALEYSSGLALGLSAAHAGSLKNLGLGLGP